jgi:hypothetical protein
MMNLEDPFQIFVEGRSKILVLRGNLTRTHTERRQDLPTLILAGNVRCAKIS